jgi:4-amino-4-deoxy-L-arabinose transferase-like glycosyltransferase
MVERVPRYRDIWILTAIWAIGAIADCTWLWIDHTEPAWDQGAHLTTAMHYWKLFQPPHFFSGEWWTELWQQSPTYRGPWVYLLTVPFLQVFGPGADSASLVNQFFAAILLLAVYGIGRRLFDRTTGLWSAGFCALSTALAFMRVEYLLDYGLTATLVGVFACLTFWWTTSHPQSTWLWSLASGMTLGFAVLAKPTNVLFLLLPLGWLVFRIIQQRQWQRGGQLVLMIPLAGGMAAPWIQQNWLTVITSMLNSNAVGRGEGDPGGTTLAGWLYYLQRLPDLVSWPLLLTALISGGFLTLKALQQRHFSFWPRNPADTWLISYVIGFYGLCSLATNKDPRFILPMTPLLILLLVRVVLQLPQRWGQPLCWGSATVAALLLWVALFPSPGSDRLATHHLARASPRYPVREVVNTIYHANPYQISTVGMLVDTPQIQAFNVDFYGTLDNFQVLGRQLGLNEASIDQDARALDWYLTKTGDQGSWVDHPVITPLRQQVEADQTSLALYQTWLLPDQSELRLYHRRQPSVTVTALSMDELPSDAPIQITQVLTTAQATPGQLMPTRYDIQGRWDRLIHGSLILTWQQVGGQVAWVQDHAIGLNQLAASPLTATDIALEAASVQETLFTLPPASLPPGVYTLSGWYLDRITQQAIPLSLPETQIQLVSAPTPMVSGVVDRVSQLRRLTDYLANGQLDPVFSQVGPLNQYGVVEAYLQTADSAARYRLAQNPQDLTSAYTWVLANVLRNKPETAIAGLQQVTQLDAENPYAWAYLAFVHLYCWQPRAADQALAEVNKLAPDLPELKTLRLISAIMQLKIPQVIQLVRASS